MLCRQSSIAIESEQRPMKFVRAGFTDDDDLRSAAAKFRRPPIGDDFELRDRFQRRRERQDSFVADVDVRGSIDGHVGGAKPRAARNHRIDRRLLNSGARIIRPRMPVRPFNGRALICLPSTTLPIEDVSDCTTGNVA